MNAGFLSSRILVGGTILIAFIATGWVLQSDTIRSSALTGAAGDECGGGMFGGLPGGPPPCGAGFECNEEDSRSGRRTKCSFTSGECICEACGDEGWDPATKRCWEGCRTDEDCGFGRACITTDAGILTTHECECRGVGYPHGCCEQHDLDANHYISDDEMPGGIISGLDESCALPLCVWCDEDREWRHRLSNGVIIDDPKDYDSRCNRSIYSECADCDNCHSNSGYTCPEQCIDACGPGSDTPGCEETTSGDMAIDNLFCNIQVNKCETACESDADCMGTELIDGSVCGECTNGSMRQNCSCNEGVCEPFIHRDCSCTTGECNRCKELDDLLENGEYTSNCGPYGFADPLHSTVWMCEYCWATGYFPPDGGGPVEENSCLPYPNAEILWPEQCGDVPTPSSPPSSGSSTSASSDSSTSSSSQSSSSSVSSESTSSSSSTSSSDSSSSSESSSSNSSSDSSSSSVSSSESTSSSTSFSSSSEEDDSSDEGTDSSEGVFSSVIVSSSSSSTCVLVEECFACNECGSGLFDLCESHECPGSACVYNPIYILGIFVGGNCSPDPAVCSECTVMCSNEDCNDGNPCTDDECLPDGGCSNIDNGTCFCGDNTIQSGEE